MTTQIAALEYDSAVDDDDDNLARLRGAGPDRLLRFRTGVDVVELAVIDGGRRLLGRVPPQRFQMVELRRPDATTAVEVDPSGRFLVDPVTPGVLSVRCLPVEGGGEPFQTEWVAI